MADEDIISTLQDQILCHILSFLQTKQSAVTSILSNRWKYLWLSVPSLYFKTTLTNMNQNFHFNDNVYTVLLLRNSPVKSFRLKVKYDYPKYLHGPINSITKWINFLVQRGVESLDLDLITTGWDTADHYILKLPISIFTCKTLVVLKLCNFDVEKGVSVVVLPSLKVLDLQQIRFPKLGDFMLFLADCPILEELTIYDLHFNSEESLTSDEWNSFCLSNLTIAEIDFFHRHLTLKAVQNVSSLHFEIDPMNCQIDFIPTFHNLTHLHFKFHDYNWQFFLQVLNYCPKLQNLEIDEADLYEEVTWISNIWVDPDFVPECLSLHLRTCSLLNFYGLEAELQLARYILKNAKVLQNMTIRKRRQPKIYSLLSSCPTASPTCKITCHDFNETTKKNNDDDNDDDDDSDDNDGSDDDDDDDNDNNNDSDDDGYYD